MEHRLTRQELYNRIWSTPMTRVAAELGTTTGRLSSLLRRAGIPTPSSGYWIKKEFGKAVPQPPLPPAPPDCPVANPKLGAAVDIATFIGVLVFRR
jgi:hypothetical protein